MCVAVATPGGKYDAHVMAARAELAREPIIRARHVACLVACRDGQQMSQRAHFWLRIAGLAVILACQFGPKLWQGAADPAPAPVAAAVAGR
jgi:hypothetical protein